MARRLVVHLPKRALVREQEAHVARGGMFLPWVEPPPEPFAELELVVKTSVGEAPPLLVRVVHLAQGSGVALSFVDPFEARDAWRGIASMLEGVPDAPGEMRAYWAGAASANAPAVATASGGAAFGEDELLTFDDEPEPEPEPEPEREPVALDEAREHTATLYDRIRAMSAGEKMQLALHGDRASRLLLLKDVNKVIHTFVVQNKKITVDEVRYIAGYRQSNPDALKLISESREWMQNPGVVSALVSNPKTPPAIAMKLLDKVPLSELRRLAKSDNTPRAIQMAARKKVTGS